MKLSYVVGAITVCLVVGSVGFGCTPENGPKTNPDLPKATTESKPRTSDEFRKNPLKSIPKKGIRIKGIALQVYVADDPIEQSEGLMFVTSGELAENDGMIFVFDAPKVQSFWMRNTIIELDIAYIKSDGTIADILTMRALDESSYPSSAPSQYALEMNGGWFANHKIVVGDKVDLSGLGGNH